MGKEEAHALILPKIEGKKPMIGQSRRESLCITQNQGKEANNWAKQEKIQKKYPNIKKTLYGRSSYVPEELLSGIQDPGAEAMTRIFEALATL